MNNTVLSRLTGLALAASVMTLGACQNTGAAKSDTDAKPAMDAPAKPGKADKGDSKMGTKDPMASSSTGSKATTGNTGGKASATGGTSSRPSGGKSMGKTMSSTLAYPTGNESTSAILMEKIVPVEVQAGHDFTYEIHVRNLTNMTLDNVLITEVMPEGFAVAKATPAAFSKEDSAHQWKIASLGSHQSEVIRIEGKATAAGALNTCASVSYNSGLCSSIPVVNPSLTLTAQGPPTASICDTLEYKYTICNTGSGSARDASVKIDLPPGLKTKNGQSSFTKKIGDLGAGECKDFVVSAQASKSGTFASMAQATAAGGLTAAAEKVETVVKQAKLELTCTAPKTRFAGVTVKVDLTVKNTGDGVAAGTVLELPLPKLVTFKRATEGGTLKRGTISWPVGDLGPGDSRTVQAVLMAEELGDINMTSLVRGECVEEARCSSMTKIEGIPAILLEVVDLEDPIEVGTDATYVITVTNQGSAPATGVTITSILPDAVKFVSATGATNPTKQADSMSKNVAFAPLPTLAPKKKASWTIVVTGVKQADARFAVQMNSDQLTSPVDETEATNYYE